MRIHPTSAEKEFSPIAILFDENLLYKGCQARASFEYFLNVQSKIHHFSLPTPQAVFPFRVPVFNFEEVLTESH